MKITKSEIIKNGERELIDSITGDLDWGSIEQIVRERHRLNIQDDIEYKQGDIIVHDNKVAYRLDFDVKMSLSVIFDREGNCLSLTTNRSFEPEAEAPPVGNNSPGNLEIEPVDRTHTTSAGAGVSSTGMYDIPPDIRPERNPQENISQMASHIAEMISQINEDSNPVTG